MKPSSTIMNVIAASFVALVFIMHSPGAAAAACQATIAPMNIMSMDGPRLEIYGTVSYTTCPCANNNMVWLRTASDAQAGRWEGLLIAAKVTGRSVGVYSSNGSCGAGWWASFELYADSMTLLQ